MAIYEKLAVFNRDVYRKHKMRAASSPAFTDTQTLPLLAVEFAEAAKEYPIVFVKSSLTDEQLMPMVLLGLQNAENLFAGSNGIWSSRYIPAFVRRYPFMLAKAGDEQLVLCLDENFDGLNLEEGVAFFDGDQETDYLKNLIQFVTSFHNDSLLTGKFTETLNSLELLEEKSLKAELKDGREFMINGFYVVNEEKLRALSSKQVHELFSSGELALVYAHLMSLSNLKRLVDLTAPLG
ncbi:MAG: SapC family protein [Methylophilaceae bacterium]